MKTIITLTTLIFFFLSSPLFGATMVEIKSENSLSRLYSNGKKARIETNEAGAYTIIDPAAGVAYAVMESDKQIMKISLSKTSKSSGTQASVQVKEVGNGPRVIGYKTKKYDYYVNGTSCGSIFTSKKALKDTDLEPIYTFIESMSAKLESLSNQFNTNTNPCTKGSVGLSEKMRKTGLAMKTVARDGSISSEIVAIDKHAKLPPNAFTVPQGYAVRDMDQMQQSMQQELDKQSVNMDEMMRQIQDSGQVSPEMLEKMKQMRRQ